MYCVVETTAFLRPDTAATIFLLHVSVRLLFKGGIYFFDKPADINDGWIGYVRARLLEAVSTLLSAVETSHYEYMNSPIGLARWPASEIILVRAP